MCNHTLAHFQRVKMCDLKICDCPTLVGHLLILKMSNRSLFSFALFERALTLFVALFKRGIVWTIAQLLFTKEHHKERMLFCKELWKEGLLISVICSFLKSKGASDHTIALLKRAKMSDERLPNPTPYYNNVRTIPLLATLHLSMFMCKKIAIAGTFLGNPEPDKF